MLELLKEYVYCLDLALLLLGMGYFIISTYLIYIINRELESCKEKLKENQQILFQMFNKLREKNDGTRS